MKKKGNGKWIKDKPFKGLSKSAKIHNAKLSEKFIEDQTICPHCKYEYGWIEDCFCPKCGRMIL